MVYIPLLLGWYIPLWSVNIIQLVRLRVSSTNHQRTEPVEQLKCHLIKRSSSYPEHTCSVFWERSRKGHRVTGSRPATAGPNQTKVFGKSRRVSLTCLPTLQTCDACSVNHIQRHPLVLSSKMDRRPESRGWVVGLVMAQMLSKCCRPSSKLPAVLFERDLE